jgi:pyruvate-formate lyase-activating enzyme
MPHQLPKTVAVVLLHPGCNMTCNFCGAEDTFDTMSIQAATKLLEFIQSRSINNVVLGGGEPFTWPGDVVALSEKAKEMGFFVQVGTNGVDLPAGFESLQSMDRYILPLESIDPYVHNSMRFYKNKHHQTVIDCLLKLEAAKKQMTISTVVTRMNGRNLDEMALFLKEIHCRSGLIHAWHLYKFLPEGRSGRKNAPGLSLTDQEYQNICTPLKNMDLGFPVYRRKDMYHSLEVDFFWMEKGEVKISG